MAPAPFRVLEAVVKVKPFAGFQPPVEVFGLAVAAHGAGATVFQRAEDGDQAGDRAVLRRCKSPPARLNSRHERATN